MYRKATGVSERNRFGDNVHEESFSDESSTIQDQSLNSTLISHLSDKHVESIPELNLNPVPV